MLLKSRSFILLLKVLTGLLFIFSGLIKLNDPVGFSSTIETYLKAFSTDISGLMLHLIPYSLGLAISLCVIEVVLGLALLIHFQPRWVMRCLWLLTGFFTSLTLYTLWLQRVDSCGCFSDAIQLTPTQSFAKNLLIIFMLYLIQTRLILTPNSRNSLIKASLLAMATLLSVALGIYTYRHLPIIDFGTYPVGTSLNASKASTMPLTSIEIGTKKRTAYGHQSIPGTSDVMIWDKEKEITSDLLQGTQLLYIVHTSRTAQEQLHVLELLNTSVTLTWLLPLHLGEEILPKVNKKQIAWASDNFLRAILKTGIGFVLLQDGKIIGKWNYRDIDQLSVYLTQNFSLQ